MDIIRDHLLTMIFKHYCLTESHDNSDTGRRRSLTQRGASDWLLALPVPHLQHTTSPESFRCRLQYQLLIPIFQEGSQCPYCLRELDVWGDHAVHCTFGGDVSTGITPVAMVSMQSLLQLDSESPGNQRFLHPSLALNAVVQTSIFTSGK